MQSIRRWSFRRFEDVSHLLVVRSILFGVIGRETLSIRWLRPPRVGLRRMVALHSDRLSDALHFGTMMVLALRLLMQMPMEEWDRVGSDSSRMLHCC